MERHGSHHDVAQGYGVCDPELRLGGSIDHCEELHVEAPRKPLENNALRGRAFRERLRPRPRPQGAQHLHRADCSNPQDASEARRKYPECSPSFSARFTHAFFEVAAAGIAPTPLRVIASNYVIMQRKSSAWAPSGHDMLTLRGIHDSTSNYRYEHLPARNRPARSHHGVSATFANEPWRARRAATREATLAWPSQGTAGVRHSHRSAT